MEDGAVPKHVTTPPNNLPLQMNRFIGRERELSAVRGLLLTSRLLTLAGAGGSGSGGHGKGGVDGAGNYGLHEGPSGKARGTAGSRLRAGECGQVCGEAVDRKWITDTTSGGREPH